MDTVLGLAPGACPAEHTLQVIGGRWKLLILYHLRGGPKRLNELRRMIQDISRRMLTQHLRELEADGIINRRIFAVTPPHVEYSFLELRRGLLPILDAMADRGSAHLSEDGQAGVAA